MKVSGTVVVDESETFDAPVPPHSKTNGQETAGPIVRTLSGKIRGIERNGVMTFLGVPYGDDTGGSNRWLPPKSVASWSGIRDAIEHGPCAPQPLPLAAPMIEETLMSQQGPCSEDCLRLNIYTPAVGATSEQRAVMVWFHGGGYAIGSGNTTSYNGENLARKQDVVVVTVTHRLNALGFLYLGDMFGEKYADSANVGMLDCIAALRWVRENIAEFGGDPSRVLIFGQSGGAGKVSTLMGMPDAQGLFHRAAAQSGAAVKSIPLEVAQDRAGRIIDALGVRTMEGLQALSMGAIVETAIKTVGLFGFEPSIDGRNLPSNVFDPIASALSKNVPLICSMVETESASWGAPIDPIDDEELIKQSRQLTHLHRADAESLLRAFRDIYPGKDNTYLFQLLMSQWKFGETVMIQAERKARQSINCQDALCYFLYFGHHTDVRGGRLRAPHTSEIPYIFDSLDNSRPIVGEITAKKQKLADTMSKYWANFAKTGDPNIGDLPKWLPFNLDKRQMLVVNIDGFVEAIEDPLGRSRKVIADFRSMASHRQGGQHG